MLRARWVTLRARWVTLSTLRTGVLQRRIDWAALTGDTGRTREEERAKLIAELHQGGVREVPSPSPCCPTPRNG